MSHSSAQITVKYSGLGMSITSSSTSLATHYLLVQLESKTTKTQGYHYLVM